MPAVGEISPDNFVIVRLLYKGKKNEIFKYFLAKVISLDGAETVKVKFLRRDGCKNSFHFPNVDDVMDLERHRIIFVHSKTGISSRRGYYTIQDKGAAVNLLLTE